MATTEKKTTKTLEEALLEVQSKLKAPKGLRNTFGNYSYRNTEGILEAVKPLLLEEGLTLKITDGLEAIGDRYYVKATVILTKGSETLEVSAYAREEETKKGMDASQITGSSSSYARKYALNGLFLIDDTKDADSDEYTKQTKDDSAKPATKTTTAPKVPSTPTATVKTWLNQNTDVYKEVERSLKEGRITMSEIIKLYNLSGATKSKLEGLIST